MALAVFVGGTNRLGALQPRAHLGGIQPAMTDIPDSEWRVYKLGTITPAPGHYVWMGPQNNPDNQDGLWLDYFELKAAE